MEQTASIPFAAPSSAHEVEALIEEHENALLRYAFRIVRNREIAQDIVQETFLRYLKKPLEYGEPRQRVAWLFRVTHNLCIDLLKRETRRGEIYKEIAQPNIQRLPINEIVAAEQWQRMEQVLTNLSDKQKNVIVLFFQEGLSYKEIAEVTGYSMSNVGMLLHRGLRKLKSLIEQQGLD